MRERDGLEGGKLQVMWWIQAAAEKTDEVHVRRFSSNDKGVMVTGIEKSL